MITLEHARIWDRDEQTRDFAEQAFASLLEHFDKPRWRRVLDFGCGTGLLTEKLAPLVQEIAAVDISAAMLSILDDKRLANVKTICAHVDSGAELGNFDLIVASCVCGALPDYPATLARLTRTLRPGAHFVQWDWLLDDDSDDDDGLTLATVATAMDHAGLTDRHIHHCFDALLDGDPVLIGVGRQPHPRN